jgi:histidine racemase
MKSTEISAGQFEVVSISDLDSLDTATLGSAVMTYQQAFEQPPYCESFTDDEATGALRSILEKEGDVVLGKIGGEVVSLAGGYTRPDGVYFIEELAVRPSLQSAGLGRKTLRVLLGTEQAVAAERLEIRTNVENKAVSLYESESFEQEAGTVVVAQNRQDGRIGSDERVYLSKPPIDPAERLKELKRVVVAYPSGNTTAVVFDQLLSSDRERLNADVMQAWGRKRPGDQEIEQCCFVTLPKSSEAIARVEMFGREFCGNATRSVVWLLTDGKDYEGLIEVSGAPRPLEFAVKDSEVSVEMPLPESGRLVTEVDEGSLVQLDGIAQLVVTEGDLRERLSPREMLTRLLAENAYGLAAQPAVGVSYYDQISGKAEFSVWVNNVKTIFDETACGSGTSAIGIALASESKRSVELPVVQPSGESIKTTALYESGSVKKSRIAGNVAVLYDGSLSL